MRGRPGHTDENQKAIVEALETAGCTVEDLSGVGGGCPDILVGRAGVNYLIEIKNPERSGKQKQLRANQAEWFDNWNGRASVVWTAEDALEVVGLRMLDAWRWADGD